MRIIYLIGLLCWGLSLKAQSFLRIVDGASKTPVTTAILKRKNTLTGQFENHFSDEEGKIQLRNNWKDTYFELHALGYETIKDTLRKTSSFTFELRSSKSFDPVVVTAQYKGTTASQAIQKVTVIQADQIEASGANNLSDILAYQTGIRLGQDNILGTTINMGGITGENVKILIDGVPVIGRLNGNIDLSQINLNNVERIEMIEGPLSVNYGTNALAGTINLITKKEMNGAVNTNVNTFYESIGNYNATVSAAVKIKKQQIHVSGGRNYFDGWSNTDPFFQFPKSRPADTNRFKTWKPKQQYFGEIRYVHRHKKWQVSPYCRYFSEEITNRGYPVLPYYETAFDDYYNTFRQDAGTTVKAIGKRSDFNAVVAYNFFTREKNSYFKNLTTLNEQLVDDASAHDTSKFTLFNTRINYQFRPVEKWTFEWGADLSYETAFGERILNKQQVLGDYALFTTVQWQVLPAIVIKPGIRYAYNTVYESPVIPSLNLKWTQNNWTTRASVARGFRAPSLKELYFDFVDINHNIQGNTALKAEQSWNYTANVIRRVSLERNRLLKFEYGAFYNDINNLITLGILPDNSYTYINIGSYKTWGNHLSFTFRSSRFTALLKGSWIGRFNPVSETVQTVGQFNYSPELSSNLTYELIPKRLSVNSFMKYNGALQSFYVDAEDQIGTRTQSAFSIWDMSVTGKFLKNQLHVTIGAKNLLNVTDVQVVGQSGGVHSSGGNLNAARGTSVFVGLKYNWSHDFKSK